METTQLPLHLPTADLRAVIADAFTGDVHVPGIGWIAIDDIADALAQSVIAKLDDAARSAQITMPEQADALPLGAVVLDKDGHAWKYSGGRLDRWTSFDQGIYTRTADLLCDRGPLHILHTPEAA